MDCFSNFDRVRGWFDTEFQDSEGFTVSSALHTEHTKNIKLSSPHFSIYYEVYVSCKIVLFTSPVGIRKSVLIPQESRVGSPLEFS